MSGIAAGGSAGAGALGRSLVTVGAPAAAEAATRRRRVGSRGKRRGMALWVRYGSSSCCWARRLVDRIVAYSGRVGTSSGLGLC